jgi:hypothetical protein
MTAITEFFENTKELKKIKESKNNSIWKNSKFEDFKDLSSRSKGVKAEKIVEEIMIHSYGHTVSKPLYDGDRLIDGHEVEIKASTCWEENIDSFTWQQIRSKQKYDRIIFVGINPNDAKMWWATKEDLEKHIFCGDNYRQHGGKKGGQDLYWLQGCSKQDWFREIETF